MLAILSSAHFYIWSRFVNAADLPSPWRTLASFAIIVLAPSLPLSAILSRRLARDVARPFLIAAYTWFGVAVYLLLFAAVTHLACAVAAVDPRTGALVGVGAAVVTVIYGLINVRLGPVVRRVEIPVAKLPARAKGYSIVQLTDVHIGATLGARFARRVVDRVNALSPDLIVITGDFIDGRLSELRDHVAPFRQLRARDGVFAVTGNHEYYWNVDAWLPYLASLGIRFLRNEHVTIRDAFELTGVDDTTAGVMALGHGEDLAAALLGRDPTLPIVLLAHHPSSIERAVAAGCDVQLSGHTHGGQLLPLGWLVRLFEPHVAGLARFGATWLYVSEGTGFWGPPLRVGTSCEIAAITLV
ncbi:metallophosphoesterase [soil metagenome]